MASCSSTNVSTATRRKVKRRRINPPGKGDVNLLRAGATSMADFPNKSMYNFSGHHDYGEALTMPKGVGVAHLASPLNKDPKISTHHSVDSAAISLLQKPRGLSLEAQSTATTVRPPNKYLQELKCFDNTNSTVLISRRNEDELYLRSNISIPMSLTSQAQSGNTSKFSTPKIDFSYGDVKTTPKGLQKYQWTQSPSDTKGFLMSPREYAVTRLDQMNCSHSRIAGDYEVGAFPPNKNVVGFLKRPGDEAVGGRLPKVETSASRGDADVLQSRGDKDGKPKNALLIQKSGITNISKEGRNGNLMLRSGQCKPAHLKSMRNEEDYSNSNRTPKLRSDQRKPDDLKTAQNEDGYSKSNRKDAKEKKGKETLKEHKSRSHIKNRLKTPQSSTISICSKIHKKNKIKILDCGSRETAVKRKEPTLSKHKMNKQNSTSSTTTSVSISTSCSMSSVKKPRSTRIKKTESSESSSSSSSSSSLDRIQPCEKASKKKTLKKEQRKTNKKKEETDTGSWSTSQTSMTTFTEQDRQKKTHTSDKNKFMKNTRSKKSQHKLKLLFCKELRNADRSLMQSDDNSTLVGEVLSCRRRDKNSAKKVRARGAPREVEVEVGVEKSWSLKQTLSSWAHKISGASWPVEEKFPSTIWSNPPTSRARRGNTTLETHLNEEKQSRHICQQERRRGKRTEITDKREKCSSEMPSQNEYSGCKHKKKSDARDQTEISDRTETESVLPQLVGGGLQETKWAIAQINIFKDGSKSYAIAKPSKRKPKHFSGKTVRVFVTVPHSSS